MKTMLAVVLLLLVPVSMPVRGDTTGICDTVFVEIRGDDTNRYYRYDVGILDTIDIVVDSIDGVFDSLVMVWYDLEQPPAPDSWWECLDQPVRDVIVAVPVFIGGVAAFVFLLFLLGYPAMPVALWLERHGWFGDYDLPLQEMGWIERRFDAGLTVFSFLLLCSIALALASGVIYVIYDIIKCLVCPNC